MKLVYENTVPGHLCLEMERKSTITAGRVLRTTVKGLELADQLVRDSVNKPMESKYGVPASKDLVKASDKIHGAQRIISNDVRPRVNGALRVAETEMNGAMATIEKTTSSHAALSPQAAAAIHHSLVTAESAVQSIYDDSAAFS
jgi:hypothetical protein